MCGVGSEVARTMASLHSGRMYRVRRLRLRFQRRRGSKRSVVEVHGIDRAINASAHEGWRRLCRGGMFSRSHHVEVFVAVMLLRPLVVAWGLHDGCIRGGLISCWRRRTDSDCERA